jgi:hypothetical protein
MALVAKLDSGTLSPEAYLDQLSETQYSAQARCISILGHETFAAIFGETVRSPEGFIDREAFLSQRPPTITGLAH